MVTLPVTLPVAVGAKRMVPEKLDPAAMVRGRVKPDKEKPAPEMVIAETVRVAVPVLRNMSAWLAVAPVPTLPNAMLVCDSDNTGLGPVVVAVDAPPKPQPVRAIERTIEATSSANTGEGNLVFPAPNSRSLQLSKIKRHSGV
jgi:hypothetical protein